MWPGPIYFGIHAEGIRKQMNYLNDEAVNCGKEANGVISMLHNCLENYRFGEQHLELTCNNCAGQNKNVYLMSEVSLLKDRQSP